ncbi:hypothetical protein AX14_006633 [Amanita brunnescens Koide BX004]|nr:hypothetical protein AX14_006633 [Amanita brunnescens Koide BX004]
MLRVPKIIKKVRGLDKYPLSSGQSIWMIRTRKFYVGKPRGPKETSIDEGSHRLRYRSHEVLEHIDRLSAAKVVDGDQHRHWRFGCSRPLYTCFAFTVTRLRLPCLLARRPLSLPWEQGHRDAPVDSAAAIFTKVSSFRISRLCADSDSTIYSLILRATAFADH